MAPVKGRALTRPKIKKLEKLVENHRYPERDRVLLLLSLDAGLTATEIAELTWPMVTDDKGRVDYGIRLPRRPGRYGKERRVSMLGGSLRQALITLKGRRRLDGPVIVSERGGPMTRDSIVNWFTRVYDEAGFRGCTSRTGKLTSIARGIMVAIYLNTDLDGVMVGVGHRTLRSIRRYEKVAAEMDPSRWRWLMKQSRRRPDQRRWIKRR